MTVCVLHVDDPGHLAEPGWLCCEPGRRRLDGCLIAIPEVWLQLWSLGRTERDTREGLRREVAYEPLTGRPHVVTVPGPADPVANVFTAGPMPSGWRSSQIRSTRPERVPVSLDVVDVTAGVNHEARRLYTRSVLGLEPDQEGHLSAATVLHRWVLRWAARRREREPRRDVATMAGWLRDRLDWACGHDELLGEFAEELSELRRVMDGLAGNFKAAPEPMDRPCPACGALGLVLDRASELIRCGHCDRALTDDEYREHLEGVIKTNWTRFDYNDKANTAPKHGDPVLIREDFYEEGVTLGYFDGYTFRTWAGSDDCSVSYWAEIHYPADPGPAKDGTE